MASTANFRNLLLTDANARAEFAKNTHAFIQKHGVKLPAGTKLPDRISEGELDNAVSLVKRHLGHQDVDKLQHDPAAVSKFVQSAFPSRGSEAHLDKIKGVMAKHGASAPASAEEARSIAVVVAVVAVPVAVFGAAEE